MSDLNDKGYKYLNNIQSPGDLKKLQASEVAELADEIRKELVETVSTNGGHLASNLGVVEMTLAVHTVFDSPKDHIIFDVGHQSYVHKMLTGRASAMHTLRTPGGISGFTNREESEHDCFGAGHSSTSLSAALGFAISDRISGSDAYTVAIVGDGAYTGGMIHEALNNCRKDIKLIIIMNENEMSISKNIGRFARHLSKIRNKSGYFSIKKATGIFLKKIPLIGKPLFGFILGVKKTLKNVLYGSNYFESMGLTYLGPIDGNNYLETVNLLTEAKKLNESVVVHIKTKKGKGYAPAEQAPDQYHGMSPKNSKKPSSPNFSHVMGRKLTEMAKEDPLICAVTAAMCDGTGLESFRDEIPERFFDVGIAEEHATTFCAGLSANQMKPYFAVYSSFLQRAYDNVIHDVALQRLPVKLLIDRAGLNASDGATHHGIFDVAFLSHIPDIKIYTPITNQTLELALLESNSSDIPCAIRYPNASEDDEIISAFYPQGASALLGCVKNYTDPNKLDAVIITHGRIVKEALEASKMLKSECLTVGIILLEVLKPYNETAQKVADFLPSNECRVVFLEEEIKYGGMGMILSEELSKLDVMKNKSVRILATNDTFVKRKAGEDIYHAAGVSRDDILLALTDR